MHPIAARGHHLPFHDPAFTWEHFEGFCCDFLNAGPRLRGADGKERQIVNVSRYGSVGHSQRGIDLRARMDNGEEWAFQCKHVKKWLLSDTERVVDECNYTASRKFLFVTAKVSPGCRDVMRRFPEWVLYDKEDLEREVLLGLEKPDAARLISQYFGPGCAETLLGIPSASPFVTAEAFFAQDQDRERCLTHNLKLVGHQQVLNRLDRFMATKRTRVALLVSMPGMGKSRILKEWSRSFGDRHPDFHVRFVWKDVSAMDQVLETMRKPTVLVLDDARPGEDRLRTLYRHLPHRPNIKLVLSLRSGSLHDIQHELTDAGYDLSQIGEPIELKPLSRSENLALADEALGPELMDDHRLALADVSSECPLIAVLAAGLLRQGKLSHSDFRDHDTFRHHFFDTLLREAKPVEEHFGPEVTRDTLKLVALLGPAPRDRNFLSACSSFLGGGTQPHRVSSLLEELKRVGLMIEPEAGLQVVPELLADHLAYSACYTTTGLSTSFAERCLEHFSQTRFPSLLRRLASAESRATLVPGSRVTKDSVVEPLWRLFEERFKQSEFSEQCADLQEWSHIAHLLPSRTLHLARLAMEKGTEQGAGVLVHETYERKLLGRMPRGIPSILRPLAQSSRSYVRPCLDLLWELMCTEVLTEDLGSDSALTVMGDIVSFKVWKPLEIQSESLTWLESKLMQDVAWREPGRAGLVLKTLLGPIFVPLMEERWNTEQHIHSRTVPVSLAKTAALRDRALALCRRLATPGSVSVTLAVIQVLEMATGRLQFRQVEAPSLAQIEYQRKWLRERVKALDLLHEIVGKCGSELVRFRVRQVLLRPAFTEIEKEFATAGERVLAAIPSTLELRVLIAAMSCSWDEYPPPSREAIEGWGESAQRNWSELIRTTAAELLDKTSTPTALLAQLETWQHAWVSEKFSPGFRPLLRAIAIVDARRSLELATAVIESKSPSFGPLLDELIMHPTVSQPDHRLRLCDHAVQTNSEPILMGTIEVMLWWRQEGSMPEAAWKLTQTLAATASLRLAERLVDFVWFNRQAAGERDWAILSRLPIHADAPGLATLIVTRAADLLRQPYRPTTDMVDGVLSRLETLLSFPGHEMEHVISAFAAAYPGRVFMLFWLRGMRGLEGFPGFQLDSFTLSGAIEDPEVGSVVEKLLQSFEAGSIPGRFESTALQNALWGEEGSARTRLSRFIEAASTAEQLEWFAGLIADWPHSWFLLTEPDLVRAVLAKALPLDAVLHERLIQKLARLDSMREQFSEEASQDWRDRLATAETLAHQYASDVHLGAVYRRCVELERDAGARRWQVLAAPVGESS